MFCLLRHSIHFTINLFSIYFQSITQFIHPAIYLSPLHCLTSHYLKQLIYVLFLTPVYTFQHPFIFFYLPTIHHSVPIYPFISTSNIHPLNHSSLYVFSIHLPLQYFLSFHQTVHFLTFRQPSVKLQSTFSPTAVIQ